jgi:hypothetical protein
MDTQNKPLLVCKPPKDFIELISYLFFLLVLFSFKNVNNPVLKEIANIFLVFIFCLIVYVLVLNFFQKIVVTEEAITSIGRTGKNSILWTDIIDFYFEPNLVKKREVCKYFVVSKKSKITFDDTWFFSIDLMQIIKKRATNAIAKNWNYLGLRDFELPFEMSPSKKDYNLFCSKMCFIEFICILSMILFYFYLPNIPLFFCFFFYFVFIFFMLMWAINSYKNNKNHKLIIDDERIRCFSNSHEISIDWKDVTDYYISSFSEINIISKEKEIKTWKSFGAYDRIYKFSIKNYVQTHAIYSKTNEWRTLRTSQSLEKENKLELAKGLHRYSYKNRIIRIISIFLSFLSLIPLMFFVFYQMGLMGKLESSLFIIDLLFFIGTIYSWLLYSRGAIVFDDEFLTYIPPYSEKRMAWTEIKTVDLSKLRAYSRVLFCTNRDNFSFSTNINKVDELIDEIKKRAVNAQIILPLKDQGK